MRHHYSITSIIIMLLMPVQNIFAQQNTPFITCVSRSNISSITALMHSQGYLEFNFTGMYNPTKPSGSQDYEHIFTGAASLLYNFSDDVELTMSLYALGQGLIKAKDEERDVLRSGLGHSEIAAKMRFPSLTNRLNIASRLSVQIPMGANFTVHPSYPFDTNCYSLEFMFIQSILLSDNFRLHFNEGYRWRGLRSKYTKFVDLWRTNMGASYRINKAWYGFSEISSAIEMDDNVQILRDRLVFTQAFQYLTSRSMDLNLAMQIRLNQKRSDGTSTRAENWRVLFGISFPLMTRQADQDRDGIPDYRDVEPNTPSGWPTDSQGRALDSDLDGVPDGLDTEANTPAGAIVDNAGRSRDSDNDGIPDGIDKEPNTMTGAVVNMYGIAIDSDGDGVPDGVDIEPNTPHGAQVDTQGRLIPSTEFELLTKGLLRINKIYFNINKAIIKPESYEVLNEIGRILEKHPEIIVQIAGHTDATGSDEFNMKLSIDRAHSVRHYLLNNFKELDGDKLIAIGYGNSKPVRDEDSGEARTLNRRVEFKVLNFDQIRK